MVDLRPNPPLADIEQSSCDDEVEHHHPTDPLALSAVLAVVLIVATLASLVPAARVAFVRPMQVLRDE